MLAVGFDLDNTLYNRNENIINLIESFMSKLDIEIPTDYFLEKFNEQSEIEYQKFIRGEKERETYRIDRIIQTFSAVDIDVPFEYIMEFKNHYDAMQSNLNLRSFVIDFIQILLQEGHELFILTNGSSQDQRNKLESLSLGKYISRENWFISEELDMTKPHKEIFQYVEEQIGHRDFLYIGDNFTNDIEPTQKLGWTSIYINENTQKARINSDYFKVKNFEEILEYYIETDQFRK